MFNETAHSVFVRERLLPCRVAVGSMGCIVYTDYVYPAFDPLVKCKIIFSVFAVLQVTTVRPSLWYFGDTSTRGRIFMTYARAGTEKITAIGVPFVSRLLNEYG